MKVNSSFQEDMWDGDKNAIPFNKMCEVVAGVASLCMVKQFDQNLQSIGNHNWQCVCVFVKPSQHCR